MKVSLFASAVNVGNWKSFMENLCKNKVDYEVVFVGPVSPPENINNLKYIKTADIKPAQCYQIGAMEADGDILGLTADDAIYPPGILDAVVDVFQKDRNIVLGTDIDERGGICKYESYTIGDDPGGFIMCPFGFFTKELFNTLGGFDRNFVTGQYENDFFMRCHKSSVNFKKLEGYVIKAEHYKASRFSDHHDYGRQRNKDVWFSEGWKTDRMIPFEPYSRVNIKEKSQDPVGGWVEGQPIRF